MAKYAAMILLKDEKEWRYVSKTGYKAKRNDVKFSNMNKNDREIKDTLYDSTGEAETALYKELTSNLKGEIAAIKISLMNNYNLDRESEVTMYRELK
jgi:hypothetical protein